MRLLTRPQLRRRLALLAVLTATFTAGVWATELTINAFDGATPWSLFAGLLGGLSLFSLSRWRAIARTESQEEWQPALMLRVLGGGMAFQAGVIGYFVANDVIAASIGCAGFLFVLAYAVVRSSLRSMPDI